MNLTCKATISRLITLGLLIVISLSNLGCRSFTGHGCELVVHPHVCPTCNARSVEACRCFPSTGQAGYHETQWNSLGPNVYYEAFSGVGVQRAAEPVEALPVLEMQPSRAIPSLGDQSRRSRSTQMIAPVAHWEFDRLPGEDVAGSAVSVRIVDEVPAVYDYFSP